MLAVIETHPIQYHVPVYRALQQTYGVPVTAIYGSDFSLRRYHDREFGVDLTWDVDLLGGFGHHFLSSVDDGGSDEPGRIGTPGLAAALERLRPAAVLIVGYSPAFHRKAWGVSWRQQLPILFRGEVTDFGQARPRSVAAARDVALRLAYRSCARLLYIGSRARQHFRDHGVGDDRLEFSPYCVDTTPFSCGEPERQVLRRAARAELGLADDRIVLLFAGKLSERKGVDLLVPAIRGLPSSVRERVAVVCAGDGPSRASIEAAAGSEPRVPVVVLGVLPQRALSRWYHAADLLVLPSHGETWGLVVNEALHHGLPVVVTDRVGCAADLVDASTGRICAAGSVEGLTRAVAEALVLVGREPVRDGCRRQVSAYSVDGAAAGLARAYDAATSGRSVA